MKNKMNIKFISILLLFIIIFSYFDGAQAEMYFYKTEYGYDSAKIIWNIFNELTDNQYLIAGLVGMAFRESKFQSNAVGGCHYLTGIKDISKEFTEKIDFGLEDGSTKEIFIKEISEIYGGYGLFQYCGKQRLEDFYDYAVNWGTSISDAAMQCSFALHELKNTFSDTYEQILKLKNAYDVGVLIGIYYDGTRSYEAIGDFAYEFYTNYERGNYVQTEEEQRELRLRLRFHRRMGRWKRLF